MPNAETLAKTQIKQDSLTVLYENVAAEWNYEKNYPLLLKNERPRGAPYCPAARPSVLTYARASAQGARWGASVALQQKRRPGGRRNDLVEHRGIEPLTSGLQIL